MANTVLPADYSTSPFPMATPCTPEAAHFENGNTYTTDPPSSLQQVMAASPTVCAVAKTVQNKSIMTVNTLETLKKLSVPDPKEVALQWTAHHFYAVANFWEACGMFDLPKEWGNNQILAFIELLDRKYYSISTLESNWCSLKHISTLIDQKVSIREEIKYKQL